MERHQEDLNKARRNLQVADHMAYVTYKLIKDPKILLSMLENIFLSFTNAMSSLLHYERMYKRVPIFADNFESKYSLFREKIIPRYKMDRGYLDTIRETKEILVLHKKSPVEFSRKGVLVICSDDYRMKSVTIEDIKKYLAKAKLFIDEIGVMVR